MRISRTNWLPIISLAAALATQPSAFANNNNAQDLVRTFNASADKVYAAAVQVASAAYNLKSAVKEAYAVNFFTGGQYSWVLSAICHDAGNGQTIVTLSIAPAVGNPQIFLLGREKAKLANRFWAQLESALSTEQALDARQSSQSGDRPQVTDSAQETTPGTVDVVSVPDGGEVYVDDGFMGDAPAVLKLKPGKHVIRVTMSGYQDWQRELFVSGGSANLKAKLTAASSSLAPESRASATTKSQEVSLSKTEAERTTHTAGNSGWIGITTRDDPARGVVIAKVLPGSSASQAGLQEGDVIVELNGKPVKSGMQFDVAVSRCAPGSQIRIAYMRGRWKVEVEVTVGTID